MPLKPPLPAIYTIGHSTRAIEEFIQLVSEHSLGTLVDVRRFPYSRRHPQFGKEELAKSLSRQGIQYLHMESLGGRRQTSPDSVNRGWKNDSFRGYADHMATPEFQGAIGRIESETGRCALMCAEAVPWQCHRNMISDEMVRRGHPVIHILGPASTRAHELNPMAVDTGAHLIYPAVQGVIRWEG